MAFWLKKDGQPTTEGCTNFTKKQTHPAGWVRVCELDSYLNRKYSYSKPATPEGVFVMSNA